SGAGLMTPVLLGVAQPRWRVARDDVGECLEPGGKKPVAGPEAVPAVRGKTGPHGPQSSRRENDSHHIRGSSAARRCPALAAELRVAKGSPAVRAESPG